jgi:NADH:ubiquinone oxidoreductase subunit 3 (subunit A)
MSKQHQNQTKTAIMVIVIISTIVLMGVNIITPINAKKLSDQQRYDSGWKDGARDCGNSDVINSYIQSSAYLGHSDLYHQGYKAAAYDCGNNNNNYPSSHYNSVSSPSTDNQNGYSQNDNNNNNNNRNQAQGQTNSQKVICIVAVGTCGGATSGQSEGLSN